MLLISVVWATCLTAPLLMEEEEKCVENAQEAVDDALEACACGLHTPLGPHTVSGGGRTHEFHVKCLIPK